MEIKICPECNRVFYSFKSDDPLTFSHCRYNLLNKRFDKRIQTKLDSVFVCDREKKSATMLDYSINGAKIIYKGEPLPINKIIKLKVKELEINMSAKVVWTDNIEKLKFSTGLKSL